MGLPYGKMAKAYVREMTTKTSGSGQPFFWKHLAECITTTLTHRCVKAHSPARWVILESFHRDETVCIFLRNSLV